MSLSIAKKDALYVAYLKLYDPPKFSRHTEINKEYNEYCKNRFYFFLHLIHGVIFTLGAILLHFHPWTSSSTSIVSINVYKVFSKITFALSAILLTIAILNVYKAHHYCKNFKNLDFNDKVHIERGAFLIFQRADKNTQKIYEEAIARLPLHQTIRA